MTKILILGSFPGEESLKKREYYANSRNQFWKIVGQTFKVDISTMAYGQRKNLLLKHNIGLWDIFSSCKREGSADARITNGTLNNFSLLKKMPQLRVICYNGKQASKYSRFPAPYVNLSVQLPSTSPANTNLRYQEKLRYWKKMLWW